MVFWLLKKINYWFMFNLYKLIDFLICFISKSVNMCMLNMY